MRAKATLLLVILLSLVSCRTGARRTLRIGADNTAPYYTIQKDGSIVGLAVDVLGEAARRRGIALVWVPISGISLDRAFELGMVDAWPAVSRTPEREKLLHLTPPWLEGTYCLVSRKDRPEQVRQGRRRTAVRNSPRISRMVAQLFPSDERLLKPVDSDVLSVVCKEEADQGFMESQILNAALLERPDDCSSTPLATHFVSGVLNPISIASTREFAPTVDAIQGEIGSLIEEGIFSAALDRWAGMSADQTRSLSALRKAENRGSFYLAALGLFATVSLVLIWQTLKVRAARKQMMEAHAVAVQSEERFQAFMGHSPAMAFVKDVEGRMVFLNRSIEKLWGIRSEDWLGKTDQELWPAEIALQLRQNDLTVLRTGEALETYENVPGSQGEIRHLLSVKFPFKMATGETFLGGMALDVTAIQKTQEALRASEERYRQVVEGAGDLIYRTDAQGKLLFCNPAVLNLLGLKEGEVLGKSYLDLVGPEDRLVTSRFYGRQFTRRRVHSYYEFRCLAHDGMERWLGQKVQLLLENGKPCGFQGIARDVTERKLLEHRLLHESSHDFLTGLLNRKAFLTQLDRLLAESDCKGLPVTLCMCDIDFFKQINDRYGHQAGDEVLQAFGALLSHDLRTRDLVGRIAGDEFCFALRDTTNSQANPCTERVREKFEMLAFSADDRIYGASASFGTVQARKGTTSKELLAAADAALYRAKQSGRNCVHQSS